MENIQYLYYNTNIHTGWSEASYGYSGTLDTRDFFPCQYSDKAGWPDGLMDGQMASCWGTPALLALRHSSSFIPPPPAFFFYYNNNNNYHIFQSKVNKYNNLLLHLIQISNHQIH